MNIKGTLLVVLLVCATKTWSTNYSVNVFVKGYKSLQGNIVIALLKGKSNYLSSNSEPFRYVYLPAEQLELNYQFENIPEGEYTIKLYHDKNGNNKLDTRFGIPIEGYGFSNNARGIFGIPSYEKTMFSVSGNVIQEIAVK